MRVSVQIKISGIDKVRKKLKLLHSQGFVAGLQDQLVNQTIKPMIRSGISPVEGFGRFVQYKDKDEYPGNRLKPVTPPNLVLSGKMLSWFKVWLNGRGNISIGIAPNAPEDIIARAKGNNEGTLSLAGKKLDRSSLARRKSMGSTFRNKSNLNKIARALPGVPARRFVPLEGENYAVSVVRKLKMLYSERIKKLLS